MGGGGHYCEQGRNFRGARGAEGQNLISIKLNPNKFDDTKFFYVNYQGEQLSTAPDIIRPTANY